MDLKMRSLTSATYCFLASCYPINQITATARLHFSFVCSANPRLTAFWSKDNSCVAFLDNQTVRIRR